MSVHVVYKEMTRGQDGTRLPDQRRVQLSLKRRGKRTGQSTNSGEAAEDMAKEQAAVREVTERSRKFHARLDAMGLNYRDLLGLEILPHSLGDMGRNILPGYGAWGRWPSGI